MTSRLKAHWPLMLVLGAWAIAAMIVPTLMDVATTDDWGYTRLVEILLDTGDLQVFPVIAATSIFPVLWGSGFALVFGMSLGVMRLSTVVMAALGAIGVYALSRELSVSRSRSALAAGIYLFNPLSFVLSFTFMTDAFLTALVTLSTFGYVRGYRTNSTRWILAGSFLAGCAFLTRQQGLLLPAAVGMWLLISGKFRFDRQGIVTMLQATALPLAMTAGYYAWLALANDVPDVQQSFTQEIREAGVRGLIQLSEHLSLYLMMYSGFFILPATLCAGTVLPQIVPRLQRPGWIFFISTSLIFLTGMTWLWNEGKRFPYVSQFMGYGRLGPVDVRGSRTKLIEEPWLSVATIICATSVLIALFLFAANMGSGRWRRGSASTLVSCILLWQAVGVFPPSYHYLNRGYSLDRYLLPLLPLGVVLVLWAMRDIRIPSWPAWCLVVALAVFSTAATRDYLVTLDVIWDTARSAEEQGIPLTQIDAGAAWDGYHLYTYSVEHGYTRSQTPSPRWWIPFYAKAVDSTYVVAIRPVSGYEQVECRSADLWLDANDATACLYHRKD